MVAPERGQTLDLAPVLPRPVRTCRFCVAPGSRPAFLAQEPGTRPKARVSACVGENRPPYCAQDGRQRAGPSLDPHQRTGVYAPGRPRDAGPWPDLGAADPCSGQARPRLTGLVTPHPPHPAQNSAVAARPGRPCPILRRLRPAGPPRSAAVCWRRAPCSPLRAHHADGPHRAPAPGPACHGREVGGPMKTHPRPQQLAPGKPCHGCEYAPQGNASHTHPRHAEHVTAARRSAPKGGSPSGVHCVFFRSDPGARIGKKLLFLRGKGGRTGEHRSKGGSWFCNMLGSTPHNRREGPTWLL